MTSNINVPIFVEKTMTVIEYLDIVKAYEVEFKKTKYANAMNMLNDILLTKYKSFSEFVPISRNKLMKNKLHNAEVFTKWEKTFIQYIEIDVDEEQIKNQEDDEKLVEPIIVKYIRKILGTINYILISKRINDKQVYIIRINK